jgi:AcrR family transcriptional regulator
MSMTVPVVPARRRRTRTESREENRLALLTAARELIVEVGYANAQLDEVAERAGVTKGAIYSIFGGKLELLRAVVEAHAREVMPLLEWEFDLPATVTVEELVEQLVGNYLSFLYGQDTARLLAFELDLTGLALRDPATLELIQGHESALVVRLAAALAGRARRGGPSLDDQSAALAADLILGALGGIGQRLVTSPWMSRDHNAIAAAVVRLLPADQPDLRDE